MRHDVCVCEQQQFDKRVAQQQRMSQRSTDTHTRDYAANFLLLIHKHRFASERSMEEPFGDARHDPLGYDGPAQRAFSFTKGWECFCITVFRSGSKVRSVGGGPTLPCQINRKSENRSKPVA